MPNKVKHRRSATRTERRQAAVRRRREEASLRVSRSRRAARRRRRTKVLAGLATIAVVVGAVSAFLVLGDDDDGKSPGGVPGLRAEPVTGTTGALSVAPGPTSYRVVYRVEAYQGAETTVSTEDISVQRPFEGRVVIREGGPPGDAVQFDGRSTFGRYANSQGGATQVAGDSPSVALGDLRVDASLADLVADGTFLVRERRRAIGRECQVYRTGSPLQSLRVAAPGEADYVDACLDATGLMLEELTVKAGVAVQRLVATEITETRASSPAPSPSRARPSASTRAGASSPRSIPPLRRPRRTGRSAPHRTASSTGAASGWRRPARPRHPLAALRRPNRSPAGWTST